MKKLIFAILTTIIFLPSVSFAHKEWVHQYIIKQAYLLLENQYGKMPSLFESYFKDINGNFYPYGPPSHQSISDALGGAWAEDHSDIVWGYCGFPWPFTECTNVSSSHFWNPDLSPYALNSLEYTSGQFENAFKKAEILWNGNQNIIMPGPFSFPYPSKEQTALVNKGFSPFEIYAFLKIRYDTLPDLLKSRKYYITGVVTTYSANINFDQPIEIVEGTYNLDLFFAGNIIGRLSHLLADMSVPAHVRIRSHPCDIAKGDRYEMEIGGKYWSAAGSSCNSIPASFPAENWTYQNAISQGGVISAWLKNNPLKYLFYTTAEIADVYNVYRYPSDIFQGNRNYNQIDPSSGDNYSEMANIINNIPAQFNSWTEELNSTASNSLVYAIRATAGLLYWFEKEAYSPKPLTFTASISGPNSLAVGQQGTWTVTASGGTGNYTYAWYFRSNDTGGQWSGPVSTTTSYTTKMYDYDGYLNLRADVTSGNEQVSATRYVTCIDCSGGPLTPQVPVDSVQGSIVSKDPVERVIIEQNYPNPFNPTTQIRFALPISGYVKLIVYDMLGREVARLADGLMGAGYHSVTWDASRVSSGIYIYKLSAGNFVQVKKMIVAQ